VTVEVLGFRVKPVVLLVFHTNAPLFESVQVPDPMFSVLVLELLAISEPIETSKFAAVKVPFVSERLLAEKLSARVTVIPTPLTDVLAIVFVKEVRLAFVINVGEKRVNVPPVDRVTLPQTKQAPEILKALPVKSMFLK
jgi:hypothetical protein